MAEYWDLFDGNRCPLNRLHRRGDPVPEGCYHQVVGIWIRDRQGRFLISRRHPDKPYGLYWESTGGSVVAGEDSRTGAVREVGEELGIPLKPEQMVFLMTQKRENDFYDNWLVQWDGGLDQLRLQDVEVVDAKWASYDELCALEENGEFVPMLSYFRTLFGEVTEIPAAICPMRIEDYDEIYGFWSHMPGMGLNNLDDRREGVGRFLERNPKTCFVAKMSDGIVGTVLCGHDGRRGHLYHAAVRPEVRGMGVGRALVKAALDGLRAEGIAKASLLVFSDNDGGNRFWRKMGFDGREDVNYLNIQLLEMQKFDPK